MVLIRSGLIIKVSSQVCFDIRAIAWTISQSNLQRKLEHRKHLSLAAASVEFRQSEKNFVSYFIPFYFIYFFPCLLALTVPISHINKVHNNYCYLTSVTVAYVLVTDYQQSSKKEPIRISTCFPPRVASPRGRQFSRALAWFARFIYYRSLRQNKGLLEVQSTKLRLTEVKFLCPSFQLEKDPEFKNSIGQLVVNHNLF